MNNLETDPKNPQSGTEASCAKRGMRLSGKQGWCRRCGWYPLLSTFVELDAYQEPALDMRAMRASKFTKFRKRVNELIPGWAWRLSAGLALVFVVSLLARFLLPVQGPSRLIFTISEMAIGIVMLATGQILCYMFAIVDNDRLMVLDIVLRPITIWTAVVRELPNTFWRFSTPIWGLSLIFGSLLVGGLTEETLFDWGGEPVRPRLLQAISAHANKASGEEEKDNPLKRITENAAKKPPKGNENIDCLIIGFTPAGANDFSALILASEVNGELKYVGMVRNGIKPDVRAQLNKRMRQLIQPEPFLSIGLEGIWIKPSLLCRVSAIGRTSSEKLVEPSFKELLSDMSMGL